MTTEDILTLSPKFWDFHLGLGIPWVRDTAAFVLLMIHWNACMGTIASFTRNGQRPDLLPLLKSLECFEVFGQFLLTELGHGLDARNLETTATLQPDGSFVLQTPRQAAAKTMPCTTPLSETACVAVVCARLILSGGEDAGVRPFVVHLRGPGGRLAPGITSRLLPGRPGSKPVDNSITTFDQVRLPAAALLGSLDKPENERDSFLANIHRITVGNLAVGMPNVPVLRVAAMIAGRYSLIRTVDDGKPIITFGTQYGPILRALAHASVFEAWAHECSAAFRATSDPPTQSAIGAVYKGTVFQFTEPILNELEDRCGWQGLFTHNQISELALFMKGVGIGEGDHKVLCIRKFTHPPSPFLYCHSICSV